jgi:hypothetical protein
MMRFCGVAGGTGHRGGGYGGRKAKGRETRNEKGRRRGHSLPHAVFSS